MKLSEKIDFKIKEAMRNKDSLALESLRAIKSSILLFNTQKGNNSEILESDEIKILSKLVKQRKESANIYKSQNRSDLAKVELDQAEIIKDFLPEQMDESQIEKLVIPVIQTETKDQFVYSLNECINYLESINFVPLDICEVHYMDKVLIQIDILYINKFIQNLLRNALAIKMTRFSMQRTEFLILDLAGGVTSIAKIICLKCRWVI